MDVQGIIAPAVVAALVSGGVSIGAAIINNRYARSMHHERLNADADLAEKKYRYERALADWKRKTDVAEEVLAGFYKARAIFSSARHPLSRGDEGASRKRVDGEAPEQTSRRNAVFAPLERLNKEVNFLTELTSIRYRFSALFGAEGDKPFSEIISAYNEVQHATYALLDESRSGSEQRELRLEEAIWGMGDDDKITKAINNAVSTIENLCRPILLSQPE
ncbi:hypothetical protein [Mesorhizobium sp.]|uniref:hypothetical protein n=1 Tax=Mesorhizobium sp. TaxID=1871066 RepID=UPI000FEA8F64|nr:hypothetical protein [Mesorhizobium sp.]RWP68094.1 MAG: hypothetical protein EOR07_07620 [Mesorhizobium sp.]